MHSALSVPGSSQLVAGRYRLLGQLGRGAMGIVWHGRDELLDRHVAVKQIILAPMASDADARASYQRTLREARTAARLSHAGVVTVFDVVEEDGMPWIVMEMIRARILTAQFLPPVPVQVLLPIPTRTMAMAIRITEKATQITAKRRVKATSSR